MTIKNSVEEAIRILKTETDKALSVRAQDFQQAYGDRNLPCADSAMRHMAHLQALHRGDLQLLKRSQDLEILLRQQDGGGSFEPSNATYVDRDRKNPVHIVFTKHSCFVNGDKISRQEACLLYKTIPLVDADYVAYRCDFGSGVATVVTGILAHTLGHGLEYVLSLHTP